MHHGDKRPKGKAFTSALQGQDLVITSSLIHRDVKELQSIDWQTIVLDEAQNVKSRGRSSPSQWQLQSSFQLH